MHFNDQRNFVETDNNHFHFTDQNFASNQSIFVGTDKNYFHFIDPRNVAETDCIYFHLTDQVSFSKLVTIVSMLPTKVSFVKTDKNDFSFATDQSIFVKTDNDYCYLTDQRIIVENDDDFTDHFIFTAGLPKKWGVSRPFPPQHYLIYSPLTKTYQLHQQGIEKQNWPANRLLIIALLQSQSFLEIQLFWKTRSFVSFRVSSFEPTVRQHFLLQKAFLKFPKFLESDGRCHHYLEHSRKIYKWHIIIVL